MRGWHQPSVMLFPKRSASRVPLFGLMAGGGGYVQGSGPKAVGHSSHD